MVNSCEFDITQSYLFENTARNSATFQPKLLLQAYRLAAARGFPELLVSTFYLFRENENATELTIECDILDSTDESIAIECYLYKRTSTAFIAKSFFIFTNSKDF